MFQLTATLYRVLGRGAVPAFGAGLAMPQLDADALLKLTPVPSPAAAEIARARRGLSDFPTPSGVAAPTPPSLPPFLGARASKAGGAVSAMTPELAGCSVRLQPVFTGVLDAVAPEGGSADELGGAVQAGLRPVSSTKREEGKREGPLGEGGMSELAQILAKRRAGGMGE
jgi:hypothetical protein